ncbi:MAG: D-alanyl-D-alanine carboxypeptidase [Clostridia bacterium]|nr:D-alanyl-D-alanine carboxypeptidase [Clostridia bacterium]
MKKFTIFICTITIIISSLLMPASAQNYINDLQKENGDKTIQLHCKVDFMMSIDDGTVIFEKNADTPVAPASLTKIMTALVVLKNCPDLNQTVTVEQAALESLYGTGSSIAGLKAGETMTLYNMLCCLLIPSGNDAAVTLAVHVGGTIENFVKMMNDTAKELGCTNTHFDNPHGLDSATHKTSARDLSKMALAALKYPAFETIVGCKTYDLPATNMNNERQLVNTNFLINPYRVTYYNQYCKGIKTGSTDNAGKCLVSYASKDGYNYLAVAMGGEQIDTDNDKIEENQAFMDTNKMYNWAFKNLKYEIVTQEGQFICSVTANNSWSGDAVRLVAKSDVLALVPQGNNSESVSFEPIDVPGSVDAPIAKGDSIGKVKVIYAGQQIATAELVAADDIKLSVILFIGSKLKALSKSAIFKIIVVFVVVCALAYAGLCIKVNKVRKKKRQIKVVKYNELQRNTQKKKK